MTWVAFIQIVLAATWFIVLTTVCSMTYVEKREKAKRGLWK